jgi:hypothetical protein
MKEQIQQSVPAQEHAETILNLPGASTMDLFWLTCTAVGFIIVGLIIIKFSPFKKHVLAFLSFCSKMLKER